MNISVHVSGGVNARNRLAGFAARMGDMQRPFLRAGVVVLTAAQSRIRQDGPGWAPTFETARGSPLQRTGALFRSLTINDPGNQAEDIPGGLRVGTNLRTPDGRFNIGQLMQYGTGIFAGRGPITPKNGKFFRFVVNGKVIFARSIKGSPPRPFLFIDEPTAQRVMGVFVNWVRGGEYGQGEAV